MFQIFIKKYRLAITTLALVGLLSLGKFLLHQAGLEFFTINALFTSIIAGAVFIIGFLLAGVFSDYKEAEKMPAELCSSLENIWDEARHFKKKKSEFDLAKVKNILLEIIVKFRNGLNRKDDHSNLRPALMAADELGDSFEEMEELGMPPNYIVRLKAELANIRKQILRIHYIQRMRFIPSAFALAQSLVAFIILLLLFLKTEGSPELFIIFALISYLFLYVVRLIIVLEKPFRKGVGSMDDVSIFLIKEFEDELNEVRPESGASQDTCKSATQARSHLSHG